MIGWCTLSAKANKANGVITPRKAVTPPDVWRLDTIIDGLLLRIGITDLLWEVEARTGFLGLVFDIRGSSCLFLSPSDLSPLNFPELPPSIRRGTQCVLSSVLPHRF